MDCKHVPHQYSCTSEIDFVTISAINQLPHVWGPKFIIQNSNKTTTWCGSKGGSGWQSAPLKLKRSAPCTPGFLRAEENLPPGWYTHWYGGGSWASSQGRLWPFLGKYGRCTDRYRGGSWASPQGRLWPIVGLPRAPNNLYVHPRSTKWRVYGGKSVTKGALHPHSQCLLKNALLTSEKKCKN